MLQALLGGTCHEAKRLLKGDGYLGGIPPSLCAAHVG